MSYILDALRRADAERERGAVPGLQSQQHALVDDDAAPPRSRPLVWAIAALSIALVAAIGWNFIGGEPPRPTPVVEAPPPTVVAVVPPVATPAPVAPVAPIVTAPPVASPMAVPAPALTPKPAPAATRDADGRKPPKGRPASTTATADVAPGPGSAAGADNRVYAQSELPDTVRRELPKVAIGGASYSGDKASRMVIINGQVFHEGDTIASGLVLQQIKLKAAVLAYKGWRYQVDF